MIFLFYKKKNEILMKFWIFCSATKRADVMRAGSEMRRVSHTVRAGGARLSTRAGTAPTANSLLELPRQRRGHPTLFLPGKWQRGGISARRKSLPLEKCQGSSANWWVSRRVPKIVEFRLPDFVKFGLWKPQKTEKVQRKNLKWKLFLDEFSF